MSLLGRFPNQGPRHWHITAAPRKPGECAACDKEREQQTPKEQK